MNLIDKKESIIKELKEADIDYTNYMRVNEDKRMGYDE